MGSVICVEIFEACGIEPRSDFTLDEVRAYGELLKVNWAEVPIEALRAGMIVELEHGCEDPRTNVTSDDPLETAKIAIRHIYEGRDYYPELAEMEKRLERDPRGKPQVFQNI